MSGACVRRHSIIRSEGGSQMEKEAVGPLLGHQLEVMDEFTESDQTGDLIGALALAQGAFGPVLKVRNVEVHKKQSEGGGKLYDYKYADLGDFIDATRPALSQNGLAIIQRVAVRGKEIWVH